MPQMQPRSSILIKRYTQTRLFDTSAAAYCTRDELCHLAKAGVPIVVIDVKTGDDVTESLIEHTPERLSA